MLSIGNSDAPQELRAEPHAERRDQARAFAPLMNVLGDWASPEDVAQLGRDLETARDIQTRLLPPALPNLAGVEIGVALAAAKVIGGDFYDFVPMPGGVGIVVGDVSGKGIPAALLMVMTRTLFRAAAHDEDEPGTSRRCSSSADARPGSSRWGAPSSVSSRTRSSRPRRSSSRRGTWW